MSTRRLRSQGLEPPRSGGRNRGSSSVRPETGGGAVRTSARLRTRRPESSPMISQEPRPRSRHFISLNAASLHPLEEDTQEEVSEEESTEGRGLRGGRGRPTAARQESSGRSSQGPRPRSRHVNTSRHHLSFPLSRQRRQELVPEAIRLRAGLGRPVEPRQESFPLSSQEQVPRHSHQWHIPVEGSREAAPEASGRSRGRGGGSRPVPTFRHIRITPVLDPVPQVRVAILFREAKLPNFQNNFSFIPFYQLQLLRMRSRLQPSVLPRPQSPRSTSPST